MITNHSIEAVVFDLDGLMIDSERFSYQILEAYAAEFDIEFTYENYKQLIGRDSDSSSTYLSEEVGIPLPPKQIMDDHWDRLTDVIIEKGRPMPGLKELIQALQARKIRLAVASNSRLPYVEHALEAIGVRDAFQCVFSGQELGKSKPDPEIYLQAASCLKVLPGSCLALEDSPTGMKSALAAGMRVVVVPNMDLQNENFNGAFARFQSLEEVLERLDQLLL
jgi:HAD superfamily hydrolase (TIGR01509 family)